MDFGLNDEQRAMLDTVRRFVRDELDPLLPEVQRADLRGERFPDRATTQQLQEKARRAGMWGLLTPEEYGGSDVGMLMASLIIAILRSTKKAPGRAQATATKAAMSCISI